MKQIMMLLAAMLLTACTKDDGVKAQTMTQKMYITIDGQAQAVTLVDNQATKTLVEIGNIGGPRCCKRDSYLSILSAIDFVKESMVGGTLR